MFTILTTFKCILYNDHHHQSIDLFSSCKTEILFRKSPTSNWVLYQEHLGTEVQLVGKSSNLA